MLPVRLEKPKRSKYGVRHDAAGVAARTVDGIRFASRHEATCWAELKLREKAGEVEDIRRQVPFVLEVNEQVIGKYVADFVFRERVNERGLAVRWRSVVADAKGHRTAEYKLKAKLMRALRLGDVREL